MGVSVGVCKCVRGFAWVCTGEHAYAGVCGIARVCRSAWVCTGVSGCTQVYARVLRCAQVCACMRGCTQVFAGVHGKLWNTFLLNK